MALASIISDQYREPAQGGTNAGQVRDRVVRSHRRIGSRPELAIKMLCGNSDNHYGSGAGLEQANSQSGSASVFKLIHYWNIQPSDSGHPRPPRNSITLS
jgi:hypothetical protein